MADTGPRPGADADEVATPGALVACGRLGALRHEQLQAALDRFGLGRLRAAEAAASGNWGQNCFLISTEGAFVLRGAPFYAWQLLEEQLFARLLHQHTGAPVPWPYFVEQSTALFGWPYAIMARLPGAQLAGLVQRGTIGPADRLHLARQLGDTLAEVQELTWPFAGVYDPTTGGIRLSAAHNPGMESLRSYQLPPELDTPGYVREFLARARRVAPRLATAADEAWVETVLQRAAGALQEPFTPRCVLPDYQETNAAVVRDPGAGWRLSGVFDLAGAFFGDGEKALCRQLRAYLQTYPAALAYARAYFTRRPPRPGIRERLEAYMLADALTLWEWAQRSRRVWWEPSLTLRRWFGERALQRLLSEVLPAGS